MEWMKIGLSKHDVAAGRMSEIQDAFAELFMSAGGPQDAAMFARSRHAAPLFADNRFDVSQDNGKDEDEDYQALYFSPAATQLARGLISRYSAKPCRQPGRSALLVGHQDAFRLLRGFKG